MHELSIAVSLLEMVEAEAQRHPGARFHKVGLRIGELAGVDLDALTFSWQAVTMDTDFRKLELAVEWCPRKHCCPGCGEVLVVHDYQVDCPRCWRPDTLCVSGEELDIQYLEAETS